MAINDDVFRAILAMDSYHRGGNGLDLQGTQLGAASLLNNSIDNLVTGGSFFAQAYMRNGHTTISYRGTDSPLDVVTGWTTGGGAYRGPGSQAQLAADFYKSIIGSTSPYDANVEFTGHSLGGGLAGLMASLYGDYGDAALNSTTRCDRLALRLALLARCVTNIPLRDRGLGDRR